MYDKCSAGRQTDKLNELEEKIYLIRFEKKTHTHNNGLLFYLKNYFCYHICKTVPDDMLIIVIMMFFNLF